MPIRKVQVQHKFGIISHSQRIQLEERLTKKALAEPPLLETKKSPYEIDESFVDQYNVSKGADRKKLDEKAFQIVTRLKRRAGLKDGGQGLHVDAPRAWSELALLAQCQHEKLQEECLESLITSLDQALLSQYNIPCLFYLGKSCLHWLKRDAMSQPFLRTGELKLLTMAKLVFTRLYYHHIAGNLKDYSAEKTSLLQFLIGFAEQQDTYKPFPGALLAVRYIAEMGHKVCTWNQPEVDDEEQIEDAEAKETQENAPNTDINDLVEDGASLSEKSSGARTIHDVSPTFWHALDIWRSVTHAGIGLKAALHGLTTCTTSLSSEPWLDVSCAFSILTEASKMDVSVLKTFQSLATGIPKNLVAGNHTSLHGKQYSSLMAKHETRQTQPLAYDQDNNYRSIESQKRQIITEIDPELLVEMTKTPTFINSLKRFADLDIVEESPDQDIANENESELAESEVSESTVIKAETLSTASQADESSVDNFRVADSLHKKKDLTRIRQERDLRTISRSSEMQNIESDNDSDEEEKDTAQISYAAEIKENEIEGVRFAVQDDLPKEEDSTGGLPDFAKLNRHDTATSLRSLQTQGSSVSIPLPEPTNEDALSTKTTQHADLPGIKGWPWELAYIYSEYITLICVHGKTSNIQKRALLGRRGDNIKCKKDGNSAIGLLDLLLFHFDKRDEVPRSQDWSWHVRYGALQGLVKVCQCLPDDGKEGLKNIAWAALVQRQSSEKDMRVLEALKVGQVEAELIDRRNKDATTPSPLAARMAINLSVILLPPLPPPVAHTLSPSRAASRSRKLTQTVTGSPTTKNVIKSSKPLLKEEILLATATRETPVNYNTRASLELRDVIEDQWRKQLHEELEEEKSQRKKSEAGKLKKLLEEEKMKAEKRNERKADKALNER